MILDELSTQVERRLLFGPIGPGAFLEICGIILKLAMEAYDLLTWTEGARSSEVRDGFIQVKEQMEAIESKNDQIISLIIDTAIRDEYITTERVIMESLRCYNAYLNMTEPEDVAYWKGEFIKWGGLLRESVSFLFDGMVGRGIIAGDILQAIVTTYKVNSFQFLKISFINAVCCFPKIQTPGRIQLRINDFMGLINTGLYLQAAYVQINNISQHAKYINSI